MTEKKAAMSKSEIAARWGLIDYMTLEDVCAYADCSPRYVTEEIARRNLKAYKPVRDLMFDPKEVAAWFKRKERTA